ncbi:tetratricopeptide repeat protein [Candidatus Latescibacterota bacterium]
MYRPLLMVTYALNYAVSGYEPWSYHLVNVVVHAVCTYAVYQIARALGLELALAGLAALLFGLHPIHSEAVDYVSSRSELLAAGFVLAALWLHLRHAQARWAPAATGVLFAAGLGCKSVAIVLPALLAAHDLLCRPRRLRGRATLYGVLGLVSAAYLTVAGHLLARATVGDPVRGYGEQLWSQTKALVFYARLMFVPQGLSVDHQFLISDRLWDPFAATAALAVASVVVLVSRQWRRRPVVAFLGLWTAVALAPSSLVPLNVLVNEHRLYLPGAAVAIGLAVTVEASIQACICAGRGGSGAAVVLVLLGLYGCTTWQRTEVWSSPYSLWEDAARQAPLMARPQIMLGETHARDGHTEVAISHLEHALERDRQYLRGYERLGQLHRDLGQPEVAERRLRQGLAVDSTAAGLWGELGALYVSRAQSPADGSPAVWYARARDAYAKATQWAPDNHAYQDNLGNTYQVLEQPERALVHHRLALRLRPDDSRTLLNTGNAHHMLGHLDSALSYYERSVESDPAHAGAWLSLASSLESRGRAAEALRAYGRAASLEPAYRAAVNQARLRLGAGD